VLVRPVLIQNNTIGKKMRNLNKNIKSEKGIMTFLPVRMTVKGSDSK